MCSYPSLDRPSLTSGTETEGGWKPDADGGVAMDGFTADTNGDDGGFEGDFGQDNTSKHANGEFDAVNDEGCRL